MAQSSAAPAPKPTPAPTPAPAAVRPAPAARPAAAAAERVSRLGKVQPGRIKTPTTYVIYGSEGVGKTTLAAAAPGVILADIEDGSTELAVARYPFSDDPMTGHVPTKYQQVLDMIDDLTENEHPYRALAIDSLDRLEALMWKHLLARDSSSSAKNKSGEELTSIEDYGFGKGYNMAVEEWRAFAARLDRMRYRRGMEIILVGHAQVRSFKNPVGEDYDRYQLRINEKAGGFIKEWAKVTAFLRLEEDSKKLSKYGRPKGISTDMRLLVLTRSAAIDAKSRLALPREIEVDIADPWAPFAKAIEEAGKIDPADIAAKIEEEFTRIADEERAKRARPMVAAAIKEGDAGKLQRFLIELQKIPTPEAAS